MKIFSNKKTNKTTKTKKDIKYFITIYYNYEQQLPELNNALEQQNYMNLYKLFF